MEQAIKIKIPGTKKTMRGILRGSLTQPLVVFVHGLTGKMNEHIFFNGARFLEKHGYAAFRFELYDFYADSRKLSQCTIQTHADDLDVVVAHFRKLGVKKIFVVGHSYGGPTILKSKRQDFDRAVLWDPTAAASFRPYGAKFVRSLDAYVLPGEFDVVIGKAMYKENEKLNGPELLERFPIPSLIVTTDQKGSHGKYWMHVNKTSDLHKQVIIKGATHCFDEDGMEEKLFAETLKWIRE